MANTQAAIKVALENMYMLGGMPRPEPKYEPKYDQYMKRMIEYVMDNVPKQIVNTDVIRAHLAEYEFDNEEVINKVINNVKEAVVQSLKNDGLLQHECDIKLV